MPQSDPVKPLAQTQEQLPGEITLVPPLRHVRKSPQFSMLWSGGPRPPLFPRFLKTKNSRGTMMAAATMPKVIMAIKMAAQSGRPQQRRPRFLPPLSNCTLGEREWLPRTSLDRMGHEPVWETEPRPRLLFCGEWTGGGKAASMSKDDIVSFASGSVAGLDRPTEVTNLRETHLRPCFRYYHYYPTRSDHRGGFLASFPCQSARPIAWPAESSLVN